MDAAGQQCSTRPPTSAAIPQPGLSLALITCVAVTKQWTLALSNVVMESLTLVQSLAINAVDQ